MVSIIIPVYNTPAQLLLNCLNSIFSQTYRDYEVIMVDDGSRIPVSEILPEEFLNRRELKLVRQENQGVSAARNHGLDLAQGQLIAIVDADDMMDSTWLEYAVHLQQQTAADMVIGNEIKLPHGGPMPQSFKPVRTITFESESLIDLQEYVLIGKKAPLEGMPMITRGPCAKLYVRRAVENARFPVGITLSEDQVFLHAVIRKCKRIVVTNKTAYYYIQHSQSASHSHHPNGVEMMLKSQAAIGKLLIDPMCESSAYAFRFVMDCLMGVDFQFFHPDSPELSWSEKRKRIHDALINPTYCNAVKKLTYSTFRNKKDLLRIFLIKHADWLMFLWKEVRLRYRLRHARP